MKPERTKGLRQKGGARFYAGTQADDSAWRCRAREPAEGKVRVARTPQARAAK